MASTICYFVCQVNNIKKIEEPNSMFCFLKNRTEQEYTYLGNKFPQELAADNYNYNVLAYNNTKILVYQQSTMQCKAKIE